MTQDAGSGSGGGGLIGALPYAGPEPDLNARRTAVLAHVFGIFSVFGPLIVWLIKKEEGPFVDDQGKEAVNFHITVLIVLIVVAILGKLICLFAILAPVPYLAGIVFSLIGATKANEGVAYRYPFRLRLIR